MEGKVDEPFGPLVKDWIKKGDTENRERRLVSHCEMLGIDSRSVFDIYYQLIHRTAAAMIEARRYGFNQAMMLVHSFDPGKAWFEEFQDFSDKVGMFVSKPNAVSESRKIEDLVMRLSWVSDRPRD